MDERAILMVVAAALLGAVGAAAAAGPHFSGWNAAQKLDEIGGNSPDLNTPFLDGCPIESPDGRSLYMASNRPGGLGGLDIWVASRESRDAPWGAPVNLGESARLRSTEAVSSS